ncbi:MAG: patatin [Bacteroidetes bacterium QH_7_62_13]|nr:MAG: patatin [Bacteroidetes bacterium QH_7_62_13]
MKGWFQTDSTSPTYALVLSGGGARSAYQAGVLRYMSEAFPGTYFPILTGVSAGALNAAHLGNHTGSFGEAAEHLEDSWSGLELENIVEVESGFSMLWGLLQQQAGEEKTLSSADVRHSHGLLDTTPLWNYLRDRLEAPDGELTGVRRNLDDGRLQALAVITTNYATGQTVTWVEGKDFDLWERPNRVSVHADLTVNHVMASTSIPLVFPAVRIGDAWYGDGSIRLSAPLAPAVHLGADRILCISNQYRRSRSEAAEPAVNGYPPTAQIIGLMMNSIFIDALDKDAITLERINRLVKELPAYKRNDMRPVELLQLRPSVDLGRLAHEYEEEIPNAFQFLTTGLGTGETESPDWLSVLLFEPTYIDRLLDIGYHDARHQHDRIAQFLEVG